MGREAYSSNACSKPEDFSEDQSSLKKLTCHKNHVGLKTKIKCCLT